MTAGRFVHMMRYFSCILSIVFLLASCGQKNYPPYEPHSAQYVFDQSRNNAWGFWDNGFCGYSHAARYVKRYGITPSVNYRRLDACIPEALKSEYAYTILVLSVAKNQKFDYREITAVCNFVKSGGLLFVIAEHDNMYDSSSLLNSVTQTMGISINADAVGKDNAHMSSIHDLNNRAYSKAFNLDNVLHMLAGTLSKTKSSFEVLLRDDASDAVIAAGCRYGKGKMLVVGDSEMFWNGDGKIGIRAGDNELFFKRCLEWLLEKTLTQSVRSVPLAVSFDSEYSLAGSSSLSGAGHFMKALQKEIPSIIHDETVRIVVNPCPDFTVNPSKKNIVFVEPYQNLVPSTVWGRRLLQLGAANPEVYSAFMDHSSINILPCFITDGDSSFYDVAINGKNTMRFSGLAGLAVFRNGGYVAHIPSRLWGETSHPGLEIINDGIPMYQANDVSNVGYMYADGTILVFGDADAVANQNSNTETFHAIVTIAARWLKGLPL